VTPYIYANTGVQRALLELRKLVALLQGRFLVPPVEANVEVLVLDL
jgi:hypothetical protein